jgi:putative transposase
VKFHFIAAHHAEFRVRSLCRVLGVSRSGYYAWSRRPTPRREERNEALLVVWPFVTHGGADLQQP